MYVLVGVKSKQIIAEGDYRSELNRERINKQPNEPTMIVPKDKLEQVLKPESVEELRDKYYAVDYWQRQIDETTKAYHARIAVKVRQLIDKGYKRNDVMAELGITTGLLTTVQTEYGIRFNKRSTSTVAERRKKMIELLKSGMLKQDAAKAVGRSVDEHTLELIAKVESLYAVGDTAKEIASKINITTNYVSQLIRRSGVDSKYNWQNYTYKLTKDDEIHYFKNEQLVACFLKLNVYKARKMIAKSKTIKGYGFESGNYRILEDK